MLLYVSLLLLAISLGIVVLKLSTTVQHAAISCISFILNLILSRRHAIRSVRDNSTLPSAKYEFPNGQGDAAKFLLGRENSISWERQHGSIYRIWSGTTPEIVLTKPEHVQEVFKDSDKHLKAKNNNSGHFLGELLGKCVGLVSGTEWKTLRTACEGPFVRSAAITCVPQMIERTAKHFHQLEATSDIHNAVIDPAQDLKMLPFWIIAEMLYGPLTQDMEQTLAELAPMRENLMKVVLQGGLTRYAWSSYLPLPANKALQDFKIKWAAFNRQARSRARGDEPIARYYDSVQDGTIEEKSVLHTLDEILFANLDVTLGGISWNLVYLAASQKSQTILREEIEAERTKVGHDTTLDAYIRRTDTFLAACISESSRLRPLAAFSVPQACPTARIVGGYSFPAGTNFIIDSYALNQRNQYWGKDSMVYRPSRFLERNSSQNRYNFWRFGFGPRQCMGKAAADLIIRALLVHLVENYRLDLLEDSQEWARNGEVWINHPVTKLKCEKRELDIKGRA